MKILPTHLFLFVLYWGVASAGRATAVAQSAPTPLAPASGADVTVPLTISWSAVLDPGQTNGGYNWQVSPSSSFTPLVLLDSTNPATTQDTVSGLTGGTYFWRVQAVNGALQQSAWSAALSFNVTGTGPGTPDTPLLAPTRGYSTFHPWESVHFSWSAVPGAPTYRLETSNDPNFPLGTVPPGIVTFWNDNIRTTIDAYVHDGSLGEGTFFVRVFATDSDFAGGIRSLPSNVIQYTVFFNNPIGPAPVLLSPVNNPTLTLPVTLSWAHVPNPQASGYAWEIARDSTFSTIEVFYNQSTDPSVTMVSLTSGPKFWRVLSQHGLSSFNPQTGASTNANTAWSTTGSFTISAAPATPVSITLAGQSPTQVVYSGAGRPLGVQLTAQAPAGGASVAMTSSNPGLVPVPTTIAVSAGFAQGGVEIPIGQVTTPTPVTLTATLNGLSVSGEFTVMPPTLNNDPFQANPTRATGGASMAGYVDLEGGAYAGVAPAGGYVVSLSTNSPAATVPGTVTIPAGFVGVGFSIQTSAVAASTPVTITASAGGVTTQWQITLEPGSAPTSFFVRPMSTTNGSQGTVLSAEGVGFDQIMQVASSNPALAAVPSLVTVFSGSGIGFFNITTAPVAASTPVTISVTGGGVTLSHPLTIYPSLPLLTAITVSPTSVVGGSPSTATVTLASAAPPGGVAVNLSSQIPTTASVPANVTVPGGATSVSFTVTTFPSATTTVQLSAALDNVFQFSSITVNPPPVGPTLASVSLNPTSVVGGNSSTGTVTLSAAAPSGGALVSLSDDSSAVTVPTSVTVAAGATSRTFTVTTSSVTTSTSATVTGSFGGASRTATLTVNPGAPPTPSAPSLLSPANQATVSQPILFDWSDAANAVTYTIQIDNSSNFTTPLTLSQTVSASQATITGLPAQQLFWRVRGVNSAGVNGPFSSSRRFTVQAAPSTPSLSAVSVNPTSVVGGNSATGTVTLTSAAPSGGLGVSLSSSNAAVATVPASVTVASGATSTSFAVTTVSVTAGSSVTITATSAGVTRTATLTVNPPGSGPLPAPSQLSPANDARFSPGSSILFDWSDVTGAASYTLVIDDSDTFGSPIVNQTLTTSSLTTSTLPTVRMWWRVRANDAAGNPGNWSGARRFEVK